MTAIARSTTSNPSRAKVTYQRPKVHAPSVIERMTEERGSKRVAIHLRVEDHRVPYIAGGAWATPEDQAQYEQYAVQLEDRAPEIRAAIERGEPIYDLWCDDRFGITVPESEVERWAWFLANAMAVAAGYTSHGPNSRPINRHGPSRV